MAKAAKEAWRDSGRKRGWWIVSGVTDGFHDLAEQEQLLFGEFPFPALCPNVDHISVDDGGIALLGPVLPIEFQIRDAVDGDILLVLRTGGDKACVERVQHCRRVGGRIGAEIEYLLSLMRIEISKGAGN